MGISLNVVFIPFADNEGLPIYGYANDTNWAVLFGPDLSIPRIAQESQSADPWKIK